MKFKQRQIVCLLVCCFLVFILGNRVLGQTDNNTLSENIIINCDINNLPGKLSCLKISEEWVDKENLLKKLLPGRLISDGEKIPVMDEEITRYVFSDRTEESVVVEFGPYGNVYFKAKEYIANPEFLTIEKSEEIAEEFIKGCFREIPIDSIRKSSRYGNEFGEEGFKIAYIRRYEGYEILATEKHFGDIIEVRIYKNGNFEFERLWHKIEGFSDLMYGELKPIKEVLNKLFEEEARSGEKIYIQEIEILYYFYPKAIPMSDLMCPVYRINANGKYYYADSFEGLGIPELKELARAQKWRILNLRRIWLEPAEEK